MSLKNFICDTDDFLSYPEAYVSELFKDAYVGGWSAAQHWGLIGDMSRGIHVMTYVPQDEIEVEGIRFKLQVIPKKLFFGTELVGNEKFGYLISDLEKTCIDCILYPRMAGGKAQVEEIIENYSILPGRDIARLIKYAMKSGDDALMKIVEKIAG